MQYYRQYDQKQERVNYSTSQASFLLSLLKQLQRLARHIAKVNQEPQIWQRRDRYGKTFYRAYDPLSGRSTPFQQCDACTACLIRSGISGTSN